MPCPTAGWLNRPLMTLIFRFSGSRGARLFDSFIPSPLPLAHQWLPLMPLPMKRTAKRLGRPAAVTAPVAAAALVVVDVVVVAAVAPHTGIDSSHGSAMVTPTPWRKVRREIPVR